jgi:hypothetical protein
VIYASSSRLGCFLETLARFRPDIDLLARLSAIAGPNDFVPIGTVPREWADGRVLGTAEASGTYAAIALAESLPALRLALAEKAVELDLVDVDAAVLRLSAPRAFTQAVSRWIFETGRFDGIRYFSRYGDDVENWAVFEPFENLRTLGTSPVTFSDPDLLDALRIHGLSFDEA